MVDVRNVLLENLLCDDQDFVLWRGVRKYLGRYRRGLLVTPVRAVECPFSHKIYLHDGFHRAKARYLLGYGGVAAEVEPCPALMLDLCETEVCNDASSFLIRDVEVLRSLD